MSAAPDVLVVGAGPTGLALALQAHDHGARVRVVECRTEPERPSRALIVHPRTLEVLRPLGVTEALLARGDPSPSVHLHLGAREVAVTLGAFHLPDTPYPHLLFVRQADVERVLRGALAGRGIELERGVALVGLRGGAGEQHATLERAGRRASMTCRYVAGCDGAASRVRALARVAWRGRPYAQEVVLADVELDGDLTPGVAHAVAGGPGLLFLFAIGERATWRLLATRRATDDDGGEGQTGPPVPTRELQALIDQAGLAAGITAVGWSARVRLQHRLAARYRIGGAFLVGDAAHVHSPAGGQGMNTGLQDACNLGWKLALASGAGHPATRLDALLDSYERERRPVARRVLALTDALFWGEAGTDPVATFVRRVVAPLGAPAVPFVLGRRRLVARGIRTLSQLDVHYRRSPLSTEGARGAGTSPAGAPRRRETQPGQRLPDGRVTTPDGGAKLHELIARPGVHVLLHRSAAAPDAGALGPHVVVHRITSWPGTGALVVRPDGHVGFRGDGGDPRQVQGWLASVGAAPGPG